MNDTLKSVWQDLNLSWDVRNGYSKAKPADFTSNV